VKAAGTSCASCFLRSKTGSKSERARAPVVQACLGFERSRNTLRWATGKNEVSECLTEVAGDWAVASGSIREGEDTT